MKTRRDVVLLALLWSLPVLACLGWSYGKTPQVRWSNALLSVKSEFEKGMDEPNTPINIHQSNPSISTNQTSELEIP